MEKIQAILDNMTLEEQVRQLFIVTLGPKQTHGYAQPGENVSRYVQKHQPGGYVLFPENITTVEGTRALIEAVAAESNIAPFISIDEEGGRVSRLRTAALPGYVPQPPALEIGQSGDTLKAYGAGETIGRALASIGVNLDFAPVADIWNEPANTVIGNRAFGTEPGVAADMAAAFQKGLADQGVLSAPKHFPGHGGTRGDSHDGTVYIPYDRAHLEEIELPPFQRLIDEGAAFVMAGHIKVEALDGSGLPATLSYVMLTELLRGEMGFEGLIVTDALDMGAIAKEYTPEESAVMAIQAGVDVLLMPSDFDRALQGVLRALEDGEISAERIGESVSRILRAKIRAGMVP